jgi:alpha-tubulin suppressor-like RCC1 family protein
MYPVVSPLSLLQVVLFANREVSLYNDAGSVELIADLAGFYTPDYGNVFVPFTPKRVLDTRNGTGTGGATDPVGQFGWLRVDLATELPETVTGAVLNVTGVDATAPTHVTVWGTPGDPPDASTLNLAPGQTTPNAAVVAISGRRELQFFNDRGNVHLVADLVGMFVVPDFPPCTTDCVHSWGARGTNIGWSPLPTPVLGLSGDVRAAAGGSGAGYALRADGTVWAWGQNFSGQLGNGWMTSSYGSESAVPVPVVGLTGVTAIAARESSAYALRADGTVWAWGANGLGQLGDGSRTDSSVPVRVTGLTDVVAISAGDVTGYAVRADGTLWAWGFNGDGYLGNGSTVEYSVLPVQVSGLTGVTSVAGGGHGNATYALRGDGTVWAWGHNFNGALGNGQPCELGATDCLSRVPVQVSGLTDATAIASGVYHGMALRADGTVWAWGLNHRGILGNGADCDFSLEDPDCQAYVPVPVANLTDVTQLAAFSGGGYALRADGTVWAWGSNSAGALGNDTVATFTTVPVQVMLGSGVTDLSSGGTTGYGLVP